LFSRLPALSFGCILFRKGVNPEWTGYDLHGAEIALKTGVRPIQECFLNIRKSDT
jgi:hypothetical protein